MGMCYMMSIVHLMHNPYEYNCILVPLHRILHADSATHVEVYSMLLQMCSPMCLPNKIIIMI